MQKEDQLEIKDLPAEPLLKTMFYLSSNEIQKLYQTSKYMKTLIKRYPQTVSMFILKNDFGFTQFPKNKNYYNIRMCLKEFPINDTKILSTTPEKILLFGSLCGSIDTINYAIYLDVDVNYLYDENKTALMYAVSSGHLEIVKSLLDRNAKINIQDRGDQTALMYSVEQHNPKIAELLLDYGADIDITNASGQTALIYAIENGNLEITKVLLDRGADKDIMDGRGRTAYDYANRSGNEKIIELLY